MKKIISGKNQELFSLMEKYFDNNQSVWVIVKGNSMLPFLREDLDAVQLKRVSYEEIQRGDIILFQRTTGEYILHRVLKKTPEGLIIIGDAQQWKEGPVTANQIKGKVVQIKKKDKVKQADNRWLKIRVEIWLRLIPVRYKLLKLYKIAIKII